MKLSQTEREDSLVGEYILQLLLGFLSDPKLKNEAVETHKTETVLSSPIGKVTILILD